MQHVIAARDSVRDDARACGLREFTLEKASEGYLQGLRQAYECSQRLK